jgi:UDP-N-acetylglucosamine diphosphorylase/glucosamine-1-phosphate N-acetyltransferase
VNVIVFEDHKALNLEPISLTRPVFDIRCGAKTFIERVKKLDSIDISALVVRDELVDVTRDNHPGTSVNPDRFDDGIWLNGSVLWSSGQIEEIRSTPGTGFFNDEDMIALNLSSKTIDQWMSNGGPLSMKTPKGIIKKKLKVKKANYLWDILNWIPQAVQEISEQITSIPVGPNVAIDESDGPVVISENVSIQPFVYLKGPVFIGSGSTINAHSKIEKCIIGPGSKIAGEVHGTIFQGWSNKAHDGYLGDSFVGEWVNFGAGTTNSNLKNNYSPVSIKVNGQNVDSDSLFLGLFIGDHSKTAIGTQFNTGTNVGVGCNIISHTFPNRDIPSFSFHYNGSNKNMDFDQFLDSASKVKARRDQSLTEPEIILLRNIFLARHNS